MTRWAGIQSLQLYKQTGTKHSIQNTTFGLHESANVFDAPMSLYSCLAVRYQLRKGQVPCGRVSFEAILNQVIIGTQLYGNTLQYHNRACLKPCMLGDLGLTWH